MLLRQNLSSPIAPTAIPVKENLRIGFAGPSLSRIRPLALEPRFMFDAAGLITSTEAAQDRESEAAAQAEGARLLEEQAQAAKQEKTEEQTQKEAAERAGMPGAIVVFVDRTVAGHQSLIKGLDPAAEVIYLDQNQPGLVQMAMALEGRRDIAAIHVISHGGVGELRLGTSLLSLETLGDYQEALEAIKGALAEDGDVLLYGCNVAEGAQGRAFIEALSKNLNADIAASDDRTGWQAGGGDWDLEVATGAIEANGISQEQARAFTGILGWDSNSYTLDWGGDDGNTPNEVEATGGLTIRERNYFTGQEASKNKHLESQQSVTARHDDGSKTGGKTIEYKLSKYKTVDGKVVKAVGKYTIGRIWQLTGTGLSTTPGSRLTVDLIFDLGDNRLPPLGDGDTYRLLFMPSYAPIWLVDREVNFKPTADNKIIVSGVNIPSGPISFAIARYVDESPPPEPTIVGAVVNPNTGNTDPVPIFSDKVSIREPSFVRPIDSSGQTTSTITLTIEGVPDGSSEFLLFDGVKIALKDGETGTTQHEFTYVVSVDDEGKVIIKIIDHHKSKVDVESLIESMRYDYQNVIIEGERAISVVSVIDAKPIKTEIKENTIRHPIGGFKPPFFVPVYKPPVPVYTPPVAEPSDPFDQERFEAADLEEAVALQLAHSTTAPHDKTTKLAINLRQAKAGIILPTIGHIREVHYLPEGSGNTEMEMDITLADQQRSGGPELLRTIDVMRLNEMANGGKSNVAAGTGLLTQGFYSILNNRLAVRTDGPLPDQDAQSSDGDGNIPVDLTETDADPTAEELLPLEPVAEEEHGHLIDLDADVLESPRVVGHGDKIHNA